MRHKSFLKKSAAVLFGCVVAAVLCELILRVYNPFGFRVRGHRIVIPRHEKFVITNTRNPRLDDTIIHSVNSLGFRGPEPPEPFGDYLTVVAVGGSTTECFYLSDDKTWPHRLGEDLKKHFPKIWVNNAGLDGHGTYGHQILMKEYVVPLHPKLVLFLAGYNDVGYPHDSQPGHLVMTHSLIVNLANYIKTVRLGMGHSYLDLTKTKTQEVPPKMRERILTHYVTVSRGYERRLKALVRAARENGITPVLITQPALFGPATDDVTGIDLSTIELPNFHAHMAGHLNSGLKWDILELYNDVTRRVGAREGLWVVDLAREMPKSSRYYYDEIHFTNLGAGVARDLAPYLEKKISGLLQG